MTDKPLLVFDGNCQAQHLAAIFESSGAVETVHIGRDFGFLPAFSGIPCRMRPTYALADTIKAARIRGQTIVRCSQVSPRAEVEESLGQGVDHVVLFPEVRFYTLRPDSFRKTFNAPHVSVKRIFDFDTKNTTYSQKKAAFPIDLAFHIGEISQSRSGFHTQNHPTGEILALIADGIVRQLAGIVDGSSIAPTIADLRASEGLNFRTDHPVAAETLKALGFDWGGKYEIYRQMIALGKDKCWVEFDKNAGAFAEFEDETIYWEYRVGASLFRNAFDEARSGAEVLLAKSPGSAKYWSLYARSLVDLEPEARKVALIALKDRAETFFGSSNTGNFVVGYIHEVLKDYDVAEIKYRTYFNTAKKANEDGGAVEAARPLLNLLIKRDRLGAVARLVLSERETSHRARRSLEKFLADKGLTYLIEDEERSDASLLPLPLG